MEIMVNGKKESIEKDLSLKSYLSGKKKKLDTLVVELNFEVIPKENFSKYLLKDGDKLEILEFVGGG